MCASTTTSTFPPVARFMRLSQLQRNVDAKKIPQWKKKTSQQLNTVCHMCTRFVICAHEWLSTHFCTKTPQSQLGNVNIDLLTFF